jgi:hypothetical protein
VIGTETRIGFESLPVGGDGPAVGVGGFGRLLLIAQDVADVAPVIAGLSRPGVDGPAAEDRDGLVQIPTCQQ